MKYLFVIILFCITLSIETQAHGHKAQVTSRPVHADYTFAVPAVVQNEIVTEIDNLEFINLDLVNSKLLEKSSGKKKEVPLKLTKDLDENHVYLIYTPVNIKCILPLTESLPVPDNIYLAYDAMLYSQLPPP